METIQIADIVDRIFVRSLKPSGIARLQRKIEKLGYKPAFPITVQRHLNGYRLIDGNHRLEAAITLGYTEVPAYILPDPLDDLEAKRAARQANEASETIVPTTFVDDAELIWAEADSGKTQEQIGHILGWSREKVAQYRQLRKIAPEAWRVVVTAFEEFVTDDNQEFVTGSVTTVTFTEGLLRNILDLLPAQQLELVTDLATGKIDKKKFKTRAQLYATRNTIKRWLLRECADLGLSWLRAPWKDITRGAYDSDWNEKQGAGGRLQRMVEAIRDAWQQKIGIVLHCGAFEDITLTLEDSSVDLILTDPPYGISAYQGVTKVGDQLVAADFDGDDDWDSIDPDAFYDQLQSWVSTWVRLLRPGGALVAFTDKALISDLWNLCKQAGLKPKNTIVWQKSNPHPAALARRNLISATEFMVWAVKPGAQYVFNEAAQWNRYNILCASLCQGSERIRNAQGETLHPTQKPLEVLQPLIEAFSNRGDVVFDGFAGVGSTGVAAAALGRKFIGIERDATFFEAMERRFV